MHSFDKGSIVAVLASEEYQESDYIRDYEAFLVWAKGEPIREVPFVDLARRYWDDRQRLERPIRRVLESGIYIGGAEVERFESEFAAYCGVEHAVGVANGLEALQLCLSAVGIGPGDEVIVPAMTFVATALAVVHVGATPVPVDVVGAGALIDPDRVSDSITTRTKAIIPVHLYGHPVDMSPLAELAARHGLFLLEDCAQSHGALYQGHRCGSLGSAGAFSFYPTKTLGAIGDGGAITTGDRELANRLRVMRQYGSASKYRHELIGMNSRLDPIQAAILSERLQELDAENRRRTHLANKYTSGLQGLDSVSLPLTRSDCSPVWHVFQIRVGSYRDELRDWLAGRGIQTNIHYPLPIHMQPCFHHFAWPDDMCPVATRASRETISLPLDPYHSDREIDHVISEVRAFFQEKSRDGS